MEASNINVMLAVACLVAGTGIGALGYHLLNSGARSAQRLRLKLTERERQLSEWKSGVDDHLQQMSDKVERLVEDSQSLQQQLEESVRQLGSNVVATGMQTPTTPAPPNTEAEDGVSAPRDYADGNRGTLSEDFGLRQQRDEQQEQLAAPRY
ncbi:YhcB family protein [Halomonas huangheensis]|uniref:DUF1043 domain-containing protein n=1 Tax=Halomonas huangheensis TaxID=1178482 RepID=W1N599_9GAMM|nr:DUF1043 family protein [Halomonas huangheensis]ALM52126.1 hypothetical protein AR456_07380 [Halomonas huangheensis]ERL50689.1 hypothetical protein BJB45_06025 [Halomonas huangheensis]